MWEEKRRRESIDPADLAQVLILCKLSRGATQAHLITSASDILGYEKNDRDHPRGYIVNKANLYNYGTSIVAPHWEDRARSKDLVFFVLSGWMHDMQELSKITASFDRASAKLSISKQVIEPKVFEKVPSIDY